MLNKIKPVCFIAMAFGYDDTDEYYENLVLPVLKRNNITPVIINRTTSNDDINFQIYKRISEADFCISDLTYTRPSVYFEAGYAERKIPVIYTVRKDHLDRKQPDDRRVHFDLQMKPIIDWKSPKDGVFSKRLERRIKETFLTEWQRHQNIDQKKIEDENKFRLLPVALRHMEVKRLCMEEIVKQGYKKSNWSVVRSYDWDRTQNVAQTSILNGYINNIAIYRVEKETLYITSVQSYTSPTKPELIRLEEVYSHLHFVSYVFPNDRLKIIKDIRVNVLVVSLDSLSKKRIENLLPYVVPESGSKRYLEAIGRSGDKLTGIAYFYFLSDIKSLQHLKDELKNNVLSYL